MNASDISVSRVLDKASQLVMPQLNTFAKLSAPVLRKALSNIQGNIGALSNSQTRSDWVRPITSRVTSPYTTLKREYNQIRNDVVPEFRNLYKPTKTESYNAQKVQQKYHLLPIGEGVGTTLPKTTEAVFRTGFKIGGTILGLPHDKRDKWADSYASFGRSLLESPKEAKALREKMYSGSDLTKQEVDLARQLNLDLVAGIAPSAPAGKTNLLPNVIDESMSLFNKFRSKVIPKATEADQQFLRGVKGEFRTPTQMIDEFRSVSKTVKQKVSLLDYVRTPDRVLEKLGLKKESDLLKKKYQQYVLELPKELQTVTGWYERVKNIPNSSVNIFRYLDGNTKLKLSDEEMKVAGEIQEYLSDWAEKLKIPDERRITNYITHIFEKDFIQKEFSDDIAKLITNKIPKSVYDPFTQKRLGKMGYVEDVWRALDAYVKRGTRKYHMDQALEVLEKKASSFDEETYNYLQKYTAGINLRPTSIDNLIDNMVKQSPIGYHLGVRPTALVSRTLRRNVYRATLGGNIGSAIKNLTQTVNTFAIAGADDTAKGLMRTLREIASGGDELERVGVLADNFVQDRQLSARKALMEKLDNGLFYLFNMAEKVNRGTAYYAGKNRAISQGLSEHEAVQAGLDLARKTQFTFGSVDTPLVLQSDVLKTFGQFQSYSLKQSEFVAEMFKNKEWGQVTRWLGANLALIWAFGEVLGVDYGDLFPVSKIATGETKFGTTPPFKLAREILMLATGQRDEYGNRMTPGKSAPIIADTLAGSVIPGYSQMKKTYQGIDAYSQGYSESKGGRVRYPIDQTGSELIKSAVFGQYKTDNAKEYFDTDANPLGEKQSQVYKSITDPKQKQAYYDAVMAKRNLSPDTISVSTDPQVREAQKAIVSEKLSNLIPASNSELDLYFLDDYLSLPSENKYDLEVKTSEAYSTASKIMSDNRLTSEQQDYLFTRLGVVRPEIAYYKASGDSVSERTSQILNQIQTTNPTKSDLLAFLVRGRKEINGKTYISEGVLENLADEGLISYSEAKEINKIKLDKSYAPIVKSKKPRKPRMKKVSPVAVRSATVRKYRPKTKVNLKTYSLSKPKKKQSLLFE